MIIPIGKHTIATSTAIITTGEPDRLGRTYTYAALIESVLVENSCISARITAFTGPVRPSDYELPNGTVDPNWPATAQALIKNDPESREPEMLGWASEKTWSAVLSTLIEDPT